MVDMRGKHLWIFISSKNFQGLMKLVFCLITWVNAEDAINNEFRDALSGTPIILSTIMTISYSL